MHSVKASTMASWAWNEDTISQLLPSTIGCLLATIVVVLSYHVFFKKPSFSWSQYGIKQVSRNLTQSPGTFFRNVNKQHGKTVGIWFGNPTILTTDLDIVKNIMTKDFNSFYDRSHFFISRSILMSSLFFSNGNLWKKRRQMLSPNFSTLKVKVIATIVNEKAKRLSDFLVKYAENEELVPIENCAKRFTGEVIAQSAFGVCINCLDNGEKDEFTVYCQQLFRSRSKVTQFFLNIVHYFQWLQKLLVIKLNIKYFDPINAQTIDYLSSLLKEVISHRVGCMKQGKAVPMDYLQMLLNAAFGEGSNDKDSDKSESENNIEKPSEDDVIAEMILIIFAGFETTASTLQHLLRYLADNQRVQDKIVREIQGNISSEIPTYEELSKLTYTKKAIEETLRLNPPVPFLERTCLVSQTYGDITIPKNARVLIPLSPIHEDPAHFPKADKFDPDQNMSAEANADRHPFAFLPFGMGPRQCIGMRVAFVEVQLALIHVLRKVKVTLNDKTYPIKGEQLEYNFHPSRPIPLKPVMLNMELRD